MNVLNLGTIVLIVGACAVPVLRHYDGIPPDASAITYKPLTWPQLLGMEVEAYCAGFAVALASGRDSVEVGDRYARALVHQFRLLGHARYAVERAWAQGCRYGLVWDADGP